MRAVNARDCRFAGSRSFSGRVRKVGRGVRVDRWGTVRWVRASGARCIRRAACLLREGVPWGAVPWVGVRWELDRGCRLRERRRGAQVRVRELPTGVRDSGTSHLAASRKDR